MRASDDGTRMQIQLVHSIAQLDPEAWDRLTGQDDPFVEHAFLLALEQSGSVGPGTGWSPQHVVLHDGSELVAALPLYLKEHSYGEYVFDFAWANAAARAGIRYYPKLVAMVPFTPATGRRFLFASGVEPQLAVSRLLDGALDVLKRQAASSVHLHFLSPEEAAWVAADGRFHARLASQFHWHNRGYGSFDDHLATFRSAIRKEVRKERRRVREAGIRVSVLEGDALKPEHWSALRAFYRDTCDKHGSGPYLTPAFFDLIARSHARRVVAVLAYHDDQIVAGTLNFEKGAHLYGRYWGSKGDYDSLHFELCYHRLIERAIERGQSRFEAGAQGLHKLRRGLLPVEINNACYIADGRLRVAVQDFLLREQASVRFELEQLMHHGPAHREHE
jgi:predicted N-acyltransferase